MNDPRPDRAELFRLFGALTDGTITPEEHRSLEARLAADPAARRWWFVHCDVEQGLRRRAAAAGLRPAVRPGRAALPLPRRWALALAAAVVGAAVVGGTIFLRPSRASAAELVQRALAAQQDGRDRGYRVRFGADTAEDKADGGRETLLWTRGDRFCVEARVNGRVLAWGRDEAGRVWFAASPGEGGSFESDEVPERLARMCELRGLQAEQLLRALTVNFDLRREPAPGGGETVSATLKPGHTDTLYRSARLGIDGDSGALRRAEVERIAPGREPVTVTFKLVETGLREDTSYTLSGHVRADAAVYTTRSAPGLRSRALVEFITSLKGR